MVLIALLILRVTKTSSPKLKLFPTKEIRKLFLMVAGALVAFTIVWDVILGSDSVNKIATIIQSGWTYGASYVLFEIVFVGWTEEYLYRGTLQRIFNKALGKKDMRGITYGAITAAILFGGLHLLNVTYQPLNMTLRQSAFAFVAGLVLGIYYDRTEDFAGVAWLHNIINAVSAVILPLILFTISIP